jgi:hypothetical protein
VKTEDIKTWDDYSPDEAKRALLRENAPRVLYCLERMVGNYLGTFGDEGEDAPEAVRQALAAIRAARGEPHWYEEHDPKASDQPAAPNSVRLLDVKAGDTLIADAGFTCIPAGAHVVKADGDGMIDIGAGAVTQGASA